MTPPLVDLVLLSWDHLEETQPCVETLLKYTDVPSRLLIVDNGSVSPAIDYVQSVQPAGSIVEVRLLRNETNEGYPRGMNRGLRESTAPYVVLLNNDLLFSPGWLSEMIAVAESDPTVGVVNPSSETLGQHVPKDSNTEAYAASLKPLHGQWVEMGACVGFCMLIKRVVADAVGLMGEHFGMGYFEDTEYCRIARQHGYKSVCAKASFVHHLENRSFKDTWEDRKAQDTHFNKNADVFYKKWGRPERQAYVVMGQHDVNWVREETLKYANRDGMVWVFYPAWEASPPLVEHMSISPRPMQRCGFQLRVLWNILKKKKKFDRVVLNHRGLGWIFNRLRWMHRAQVIVR